MALSDESCHKLERNLQEPYYFPANILLKWTSISFVQNKEGVIQSCQLSPCKDSHDRHSCSACQLAGLRWSSEAGLNIPDDNGMIFQSVRIKVKRESKAPKRQCPANTHRCTPACLASYRTEQTKTCLNLTLMSLVKIMMIQMAVTME